MVMPVYLHAVELLLHVDKLGLIRLQLRGDHLTMNTLMVSQKW
jgi:hypothetical protein